MVKGVFVAALGLILLCSSSALAQGETAKKMMDEKSTKLMSVSCDPACGFSVQSHDEAEIIAMVQMHAKKAHGMEMSEADVRKMMKEVPMETMDHKDMDMKGMKEKKEE
jgi:predicted small metal-binding protein